MFSVEDSMLREARVQSQGTCSFHTAVRGRSSALVCHPISSRNPLLAYEISQTPGVEVIKQ